MPARPATTIGTPYDGAAVDENLRGFRATSDYGSDGWGVYVQDLVEVAPMWKLLGGLRWDRFEGNVARAVYTPISDSISTRFSAART